MALKNIGKTLGWVIVVIVSFLILFPYLSSYKFLLYPLFHDNPLKLTFSMILGTLVDLPLFAIYMKSVFSDPGRVPSSWVISFIEFKEIFN